MIVLVIKKSDNTVMPLRQNSPNHKPGRMTEVTIEKYGGIPDDYDEYIVPKKDTLDILKAKELTFNPIQERVVITPYSDKEKGLSKKRPELEAVEEEFIKAHVYEAAALALGLDEKRYSKIKKDREKDAEKLKKDIADLEALPDDD